MSPRPAAPRPAPPRRPAPQVVTATLEAPYPDRPNEGAIRFNVEFSPMASPAFEAGAWAGGTYLLCTCVCVGRGRQGGGQAGGRAGGRASRQAAGHYGCVPWAGPGTGFAAGEGGQLGQAVQGAHIGTPCRHAGLCRRGGER